MGRALSDTTQFQGPVMAATGVKLTSFVSLVIDLRTVHI